MTVLTDEARKEFYKWLNTDVTPSVMESLSKRELMELAYQHAYPNAMRRSFEVMKPLADPRLMILAEALKS